MNLKPQHDRIICKKLKVSRDSGIILLDDEENQQGEVIATGPGGIKDGVRRPCCCTEGDKIVFGKYSGVSLKLDDGEYIVLRDEDVIGVIG